MKLHIVHTNDMHNHFPGKALQRATKSDSLLFDSGDALAGSNTVFKLNEPILISMRQANFQAMAMGNREFHYLRKILRERQKRAGFPILSANVIDLRGKIRVQNELILTKDGVKIGVFGLTVCQYPVGSAWEKIFGWRFLDPVDAAEQAITRLRKDGAGFILCLSHLGFRTDQLLAEKTDGIHLILGGHSHTILEKPVWKGKTAILQSGAHGQFAGSWEISASSRSGQVDSWELQGGLIRDD